METRQNYITVDHGVYENWQAIGVLEDLQTDGDIAQFLATLYSRQKQKGGEESSVRCVHCRSPLTLYCSTCQCPSHLALPTQLPCPSVSSAAPALPSHGLDTSTALSVLTDSADTQSLASGTPHTAVKDEEDTDGFPQEDDDLDCDDCPFELGIVKTESAASGCDCESSSTEPVINFRLMPSDGDERRKSHKGWNRKVDMVSECSKNKRNTTTRSTRLNKAAKSKLVDKHNSSTSNRATDKKDIVKMREDFSLDFEETVKKKEGNSLNKAEGVYSNVNKGKSRKEQRKRKPCASQDLEEGHILPTEERRLAQIHVYDESYIERHKIEDDPLRRPGRRKRKQGNQTLMKSVHKRKNFKKRVTSPQTNSESSNSDEEKPADERHIVQANHRSLMQYSRNNAADLMPPTNDSIMNQSVDESDYKPKISASWEGSTEGTVDPKDSDRQSLRILVSAQKIQPLRTTNGSYARFLYSYFECAHCMKAFTHKRAFNSHVQTHIGQNFNNCTVCDKGLECPCDKTKHESRATLQCEICGVHLKSLYALRFHIAAIHKNDRPFQCTLCEKSFVLRTKLKSHMKYKHAEGGRLFQCDQCSYRSFDARGLKVHQMCVHSKERPFKCTYCPSAFAIKFYLDTHLRKHTGEKPFRCSECSQTFAQRPSLTRHRRNYHGLEPPGGRKKVESSNSS